MVQFSGDCDILETIYDRDLDGISKLSDGHYHNVWVTQIVDSLANCAYYCAVQTGELRKHNNKNKNKTIGIKSYDTV